MPPATPFPSEVEVQDPLAPKNGPAPKEDILSKKARLRRVSEAKRRAVALESYESYDEYRADGNPPDARIGLEMEARASARFHKNLDAAFDGVQDTQDAWVGDAELDTAEGVGKNLAARAYDAAFTKLPKGILNFGATMAQQEAAMGIDENAQAAYQWGQQDSAFIQERERLLKEALAANTPEDVMNANIAELDNAYKEFAKTKPEQKYFDMLDQHLDVKGMDGIGKGTKQSMTQREKLEKLDRANSITQRIDELFEGHKTRANTGKDAMFAFETLEGRLEGGLEITKAKEAVSNGDYSEGLGHVAGALSTVVGAAITQGIKDPSQLVSLISEELPDTAVDLMGGGIGLAVTGIGVAVNTYQEAKLNFIEKNKRAPNKAEDGDILKWATATGLVATGADTLLTKTIKSGLVDPISKRVAEESGRTFKGGLVRSPVRFSADLGITTVGEAGAEIAESYTESRANFEDFNTIDAAQGGITGAAAGGGQAAPGQAVNELRRGVNRLIAPAKAKAAERDAAQAVIDNVVESGDVEGLAAKPETTPTVLAEAVAGRNAHLVQQDKAATAARLTEEVKKKNQKDLAEAIAERDRYKAQVKRHEEKGRTILPEVYDKITELEDKVTNLTEVNASEVEINPEDVEDEKISPEVRKKLQANIAVYDARIDKMQANIQALESDIANKVIPANQLASANEALAIGRERLSEAKGHRESLLVASGEVISVQQDIDELAALTDEEANAPAEPAPAPEPVTDPETGEVTEPAPATEEQATPAQTRAEQMSNVLLGSIENTFETMDYATLKEAVAILKTHLPPEKAAMLEQLLSVKSVQREIEAFRQEVTEADVPDKESVEGKNNASLQYQWSANQAIRRANGEITVDEVYSDVINGNGKTGFLGVANYVSSMVRLAGNGSTKEANAILNRLAEWRTRHATKGAAIQEAYAKALKTGETTTVEGLLIHKNSGRLVQAIAKEVELLNGAIDVGKQALLDAGVKPYKVTLKRTDANAKWNAEQLELSDDTSEPLDLSAPSGSTTPESNPQSDTATSSAGTQTSSAPTGGARQGASETNLTAMAVKVIRVLRGFKVNNRNSTTQLDNAKLLLSYVQTIIADGEQAQHVVKPSEMYSGNKKPAVGVLRLGSVLDSDGAVNFEKLEARLLDEISKFEAAQSSSPTPAADSAEGGAAGQEPDSATPSAENKPKPSRASTESPEVQALLAKRADIAARAKKAATELDGDALIDALAAINQEVSAVAKELQEVRKKEKAATTSSSEQTDNKGTEADVSTKPNATPDATGTGQAEGGAEGTTPTDTGAAPTPTGDQGTGAATPAGDAAEEGSPDSVQEQTPLTAERVIATAKNALDKLNKRLVTFAEELTEQGDNPIQNDTYNKWVALSTRLEILGQGVYEGERLSSLGPEKLQEAVEWAKLTRAIQNETTQSTEAVREEGQEEAPITAAQVSANAAANDSKTDPTKVSKPSTPVNNEAAETEESDTDEAEDVSEADDFTDADDENGEVVATGGANLDAKDINPNEEDLSKVVPIKEDRENGGLFPGTRLKNGKTNPEAVTEINENSRKNWSQKLQEQYAIWRRFNLFSLYAKVANKRNSAGKLSILLQYKNPHQIIRAAVATDDFTTIEKIIDRKVTDGEKMFLKKYAQMYKRMYDVMIEHYPLGDVSAKFAGHPDKHPRLASHTRLYTEFYDDDGNFNEKAFSALVLSSMIWIRNNGRRTLFNTDRDIKSWFGRSKKETINHELVNLLRYKGMHKDFMVQDIGAEMMSLLGISFRNTVTGEIPANAVTSFGALAVSILSRTPEPGEFEPQQMVNGVPVGKPKPVMLLNVEPVKNNEIDHLLNFGEGEPPAGDSVTYFVSMSTKGTERDPVTRAERKLLLPTMENTLASMEKISGKKGRLLDALFGISTIKPRASVEPIKKGRSAKYKRTQQRVPDWVMGILDSVEETPYKIKSDVFRIVNLFSDENMVPLFGGTHIDEAHDGANLQERKLSRIESSMRELNAVRELVDEDLDGDIDVPFYLKHVPWKQGRMGFEGDIDPQQHKVQRALMGMEGHEVEIGIKGGKKYGSLIKNEGFLDAMMAIAVGIGEKPERSGFEATGRKVFHILMDSRDKAGNPLHKEPEIAAAVKVMASILANPDADTLAPDLQDTILAGLKSMGEAEHSLTTLVAMANMYNGINTSGQQSVKISLYNEIDGVTNGPAMIFMQLSNKILGSELGRFGLFTNSVHTHLKQAYDAEDNPLTKDLYETAAEYWNVLLKDIIELNDAEERPMPIEELLVLISPKLFEEDKKKEEETLTEWFERTDAKLGTTMTGFGAGKKTIGSQFFNDFQTGGAYTEGLQAYLSEQAIIANDTKETEEAKAAAQENIRRVLRAVATIAKSENIPKPKLENKQVVYFKPVDLDNVFTIKEMNDKGVFQQGRPIEWKKEINASNVGLLSFGPRFMWKFRALFNASVGTALTLAMEEVYEPVMNNRDILNNAININFHLHQIARERAIAERKKELFEDPNKRKKGFDPSIHELPVYELARIDARLKILEPTIGSFFTLGTDPVTVLNEGINVVKNKRASAALEFLVGPDPSKEDKKLRDQFERIYEQKVKADTAREKTDNNLDGKTPVTFKGIPNLRMEPGVAPVIMMIHSLDAAIMVLAMKKLKMTNVHDAALMSILESEEGGRALNEAFMEVMGKYSLPLAIQNTYSRGMASIEDFVNLGDLESYKGDSFASKQAVNALSEATVDQLASLTGEEKKEIRKIPLVERIERIEDLMKAATTQMEAVRVANVNSIYNANNYHYEGAHATQLNTKENTVETLAQQPEDVAENVLDAMKMLLTDEAVANNKALNNLDPESLLANIETIRLGNNEPALDTLKEKEILQEALKKSVAELIKRQNKAKAREHAKGNQADSDGEGYGSSAEGMNARGFQPDIVETVSAANSVQVFDMLGSIDTSIEAARNPRHIEYLRNLMGGKLNTLLQTINLQVKNEAGRTRGLQQRDDIFILNSTTGNKEKRSGVLGLGIKMSNQEVYAHEMVHAVMRNALNTDSRSRDELTAIYSAIRNKYIDGSLTYEMFLPVGVTAATASQQEILDAQATMRYLFEPQVDGAIREYDPDTRQVNHSRISNVIQEFAAYALTNANMRTYLRQQTIPKKPAFREAVLNRLASDRTDLFELLTAVATEAISRLYNWVLSRNSKENLLDQTDQLLFDIANVEHDHRNGLVRGLNYASVLPSTLLAKPLQALDIKLQQLVRGTTIHGVRNQSSLVTAAGLAGELALDIENGQNKTIDAILDAGSRSLDRFRHNGFKHIWDEAKGLTNTNEWIFKMRRVSNKLIDQTRKSTANAITTIVNNSYLEPLSEEESESLTKVILKGDMAHLITSGRYTLEDVRAMMGNKAQLRHEIAKLEAAMPSKNATYYRKAARSLGQYMVHGKALEAVTPRNAYNIARSPQFVDGMATLDEATLDDVTNLVDALASLYAIEFTEDRHKENFRKVYDREAARGDVNGISSTIKMHEQLKAQALAKIFDDDRGNVEKGYIRELFNENITVKIAGEDEREALERQGFVIGTAAIPRDGDIDPEAKPMFIYTARMRQMEPYQAQIVSLTDRKRRGTNVLFTQIEDPSNPEQKFNGVTSDQILKQKEAEMIRMNNPAQPRGRTEDNTNYAVPVYNSEGRAVAYHYTMSEHSKDNYLEKDNDLGKVMGAIGGNTIDKEATPTMNRIFLENAKKMYEADTKNRDRYVLVGPDSPVGSEEAEIYAMFPEQMKADMWEMWGPAGMMIHPDLMHASFGFRKMSVKDMFAKGSEERNILEKTFVTIASALLGDKAVLRLGTVEAALEEMVTRAKDNIVVKSFVVTVQNVMSNTMYLVNRGVPIVDALQMQLRGYENLTKYEANARTIKQLNLAIRAGIDPSKETEYRQTIAFLENEQTINPLATLIDAGLLQSIVDDVNLEDDSTGFLSHGAKKLLDKTGFTVAEEAGNTAAKVGRTAFNVATVSRDTDLYKKLNFLVRGSDLVARAVLHEHNVKKGMDPQKSFAAIQDDFINFDYPTSKQLQYLNDHGFGWFTKYGINIQSKIIKLFKLEHLPQTLAIVTLMTLFPGLPTILGGLFFFGKNPLSMFDDPISSTLGSVDEVVTVRSVF